MNEIIEILEGNITDLAADIDWFQYQIKNLPCPDYIEVQQSLHAAIATAQARISLIRTAIMHLQAAA